MHHVVQEQWSPHYIQQQSCHKEHFVKADTTGWPVQDTPRAWPVYLAVNTKQG
jgi:hypothetical protein